jgi:hypothetical protein
MCFSIEFFFNYMGIGLMDMVNLVGPKITQTIDKNIV